METDKHWRSIAHYVEASTLKELCDKLTEFAKSRFVVAWQIFLREESMQAQAVITYKELEQ